MKGKAGLDRGGGDGREEERTLDLSGMCSPLSMDHMRSNSASGKGCCKASATWKETWIGYRLVRVTTRCFSILTRENADWRKERTGRKERHLVGESLGSGQSVGSLGLDRTQGDAAALGSEFPGQVSGAPSYSTSHVHDSLGSLGF